LHNDYTLLYIEGEAFGKHQFSLSAEQPNDYYILTNGLWGEFILCLSKKWAVYFVVYVKLITFGFPNKTR